MRKWKQIPACARGKRLSLQAEVRDLREDQGTRTLAEAGAGGGWQLRWGPWGEFIQHHPHSLRRPQLIAQRLVDAADGQGAGTLPRFLGHSLKGWGGSGEAHILAFRRAGLYCLTLLKLPHL